ncbi:protein phosphatase 2C domain-containing protein [Nonomuraea sp. SBT364]|uniref:protein phosphatase 2C domain-containing protein n=1 Tax=Nonomuraea sp. SBT364 TaxID=1580530 RepID=UPI00066B1E98|nr:protein phosphatase 2C domain-containing protein [Nonomuraea sp. SBT364]
MPHVRYATAAAPGRANEDYVIAGPSWVALFDGATAPPGVRSGCVHDVRWLVRTLASGVAARVDGGEPLADVLADAIAATMSRHAGTCDLANPDSPSATAALARLRGDRLDYLVLCDSAIGLAHPGGGVTVVRDERLDRLPGGRPYSVELVRSLRNRPGGFWVASTCPAAAGRALAGTVDAAGLEGVALFTDGVTRLADWYGRTWDELVAGARDPEALIAEVRRRERALGPVRGKQHDDATAAWMSFP